MDEGDASSDGLSQKVSDDIDEGEVANLNLLLLY
jgi:hypothetical protein